MFVRYTGPWDYFVRNVRISSSFNCWEWKRSVGGHGYGNWHHAFNGKSAQRCSHRATYELFFGDPGELCVLHTCNNKRCCNPEHLKLGTHGDNTTEAWRDGLRKSHLTEQQASEIKNLLEEGWKHRDLAKKYGCSLPVITRIKQGKWRPRCQSINLSTRRR